MNPYVVLENDFFSYKISSNGENVHFIEKSTGINYLDLLENSKCGIVEVDGVSHEVTSVTYKNDFIVMKFENVNINARIKVINHFDRIIFSVDTVEGNIDNLTFLNIPLTVQGQPYEPFGACALSMNLYTHVRQLPPTQTELSAKCYNKFGIKGAEVTLIGLPQIKILGTIRDIIENAKDIPFSNAGGAWALLNDEGYGSYLMNFGSLTEDTVDEWIEKCHSLGFNQIDSHGGGSFFEFGTLELNKDKWPDGWASFKRINEKLKKAGISHIFHTYAFFIDKGSEYVTPVPSEDLGFEQIFTLSKPLEKDDKELFVNESTKDISTITGFHTENSVTLRIGKELVEFSGVSKNPPYKFTGLKRGACGTEISSHDLNKNAYHLSERFNLFVPGPDTKLFTTVAEKHAKIVNECNFEGIYFDAIDGSAVLGGDENFWYYGTKFLFEVANKLDRPVGMEMSSMSHHWWHYRSRWQAWDRPVRGYKRFIDIHLASIKASALFLPEDIISNEWEHGRWKGHSPEIDKYAGILNGQIQLPLHLGWWGNQVWSPPQIEPTFSDDIEYLGCKMIGNNAGFSQLGGVDSITLAQFPLFKQSADIMKQYEALRHQDYFSDEVKTLLRQPGKEYSLFKSDRGEWNFKPTKYLKHKVEGDNHPSSSWEVMNSMPTQPIKLRIEVLMSVDSYDSPSNVVLTDYSKSTEFLLGDYASGVSASIEVNSEKTLNEEDAIIYSAYSDGSAPVDGSYINMEKEFDPILNIIDNKGLGVWINGDGNGEILNISLRSPIHISHGAHGDHFIKIDFKGWKYFELVEIESSRISDYMWPDDSRFYVYDSYRHRISFSNVNKLQFWYNNLPSGKNIKNLIGPIKAIPLVENTINNPSIEVNGSKIIFPVEMESGMYLEFYAEDDCKLFDKTGRLISQVKPIGSIPNLMFGSNKINFLVENNSGINPRSQVTIISQDDPIINYK
ncbi:hypothetical protein GCM10025777_59770 [Membranihabitans marinus]